MLAGRSCCSADIVAVEEALRSALEVEDERSGKERHIVELMGSVHREIVSRLLEGQGQAHIQSGADTYEPCLAATHVLTQVAE